MDTSATPLPHRPLASVIANPAAGGGRRRADLQDAVRELEAEGWRVTVLLTEHQGHARELAARAVDEGADVAVVAGGDGTVNEVAGALVGSRTALAVLPAGTGNVLAAQLGLIGVPTPLHRGDLPAAARELARGHVRGVDVGLARAGGRERHFLLWAGVGFDAEVTYETERKHATLKRTLGAAAFGLVGVKAALLSEPNEAIVTGDDWRVRTPLLMAVAANIPLYAGVVDIAPEAVIDDGVFDVVLFTGAGAISMLQEAGSVVAERLLADAGRARRSSEMRVTSSTPLRIHLDAEPFGTTPLSVKALPRALRLLVPPTAPRALFADGEDDDAVDGDGGDDSGVDGNGADDNGVDGDGADDNGVGADGVDDNGVGADGVDDNRVDDDGTDYDGVDDDGTDHP